MDYPSAEQYKKMAIAVADEVTGRLRVLSGVFLPIAKRAAQSLLPSESLPFPEKMSSSDLS